LCGDAGVAVDEQQRPVPRYAPQFTRHRQYFAWAIAFVTDAQLNEVYAAAYGLGHYAAWLFVTMRYWAR
jgi:hypothetical protein